MVDFGWEKLRQKEPVKEGGTFEEMYPDYANPTPPNESQDKETIPPGVEKVGPDTYIEKRPAIPVSVYKDMPWSDVAVSAIKNAPESALKTVKDTASAVYNYDKTLPALASTATGLIRKGYRSVTGDESGINDPNAQEDINAADALINDYKDKYGSVAGFKKRLSEDPFNIGMDAATVVPPLSAASKLALPAKAAEKVGKIARAGELALDPVQATVALGKKVASKTSTVGADAAEFAQRAYMAMHSQKGMQPYKVIQEAGKIPGPDGVKARETLSKFIAGKGTPEEIADTATAAFEEIKQNASANYKSQFADISKFSQPLPFNRMAVSAQELVDYVNSGHPNSHDRALAQEALDIVNDRWTNPNMSKNMDGFDRMKIDIRDRADGIQDARLKKKVFDFADAAKKTIVDSDPKYAQMMEDWQSWIAQANDFKKSIGAGNDRIAESSFIKKLQSSLKDDRKGELIKQLSQTQAGSQLPYMIAGDSLKGMLPDWWFGGLANAAPIAAGYLASPGYAALAVPGVIATSPKLGAKVTQGTSAIRRALGKVSDEAGKRIQQANKPYVTNPLYQMGRDEEDRTGRKHGGRVGINHGKEAERLVKMAERAKKLMGKSTEALLDTPDELVAKALEVANRDI